MNITNMCKPYPSQCTEKCPDSTCKYEDPFYCGCCPNTECLQNEGDPCGGEHKECGQGLKCDDGKCVPCELTKEKCAEQNEKCSTKEEECEFGVDPLSCSCCPVCLLGPGESCNENQRCTFYTECDEKEGICKEIDDDIDELEELQGVPQVGGRFRRRCTYRMWRICRIHWRERRYRAFCRYYLICS
ncbi:hypothetical protein Anas_02092 [Armadillidium nasatum]|uniref:Uncharacterized protein n=1 Tax=Armadillidium nasatum TaxID=96803 RepID=A0A5N5TFN8_9CRUS|nr:hypothetical protein Anas_02092 [Armadillidium nasatum]